MKTALQELIEWNEKEFLEAKHVIDNAKDYDDKVVSLADNYYRAHYQVKIKATELLSKEREQIIECFEKAQADMMRGERGRPCLYRTASDYYQSTYKQ